MSLYDSLLEQLDHLTVDSDKPTTSQPVDDDSLLDAFTKLSLRGGPGPALQTDDITLVSHTHGRQRRAERGISRLELQAAVKYGRRELAHPGRDGSVRYRFTHKGVCYVTDETGKHEVTSWRLDGLDGDLGPVPPPAQLAGGASSHVVLVVDRSGSMRKTDVPGFSTRTEAVYRCIARELVEPQLRLSKTATNAGQMVVTLVEMADGASVLLQRAAVDEQLLQFVERRAASRAAFHGNYLPALDTVVDILRPDAQSPGHLFLIFLSDGAPSDHTDRECEHGVQVWQQVTGRYGAGLYRPNGRPKLQDCATSQACRKALQQLVQTECKEKIQLLGDLLGRDRMHVHTVAFGPPDEDYTVLQAMARVLPRSSFQKLGLKAANLSTAFSSLSSSLATLRTETTGAKPGLTLRIGVQNEGPGGAESALDGGLISRQAGWHTYSGAQVVSKQRYDLRRRSFVDVPLHPGASGVAMFGRKFAEGAERFAFRCTEIFTPEGDTHDLPSSAVAKGPRLVAKETIYHEQLLDAKFHRTMARVQAEAQHLAGIFNGRIGAKRNPAWQVNFVECAVYEVLDPHYDAGHAWILAERELEGAWCKWNNNAGAVRPLGADGGEPVEQAARGGPPQAAAAAAASEFGGFGEFLAIPEDEEEGDDDSGSEEAGGSGWRDPSSSSTAASAATLAVDEIPQCFSHFTWSITDGALLVCDLQGVWNAFDGFLLTDPAMHVGAASPGGRSGRRRGGTDKGEEGIARFFESHQCSVLCRRLGLKPYRPAGGGGAAS